MAIQNGMSKAEQDQIVDALSRVLADTYTLYLKTHNFHWNVRGPMFMTLHTLFETHYNELALAVDEIAERIRSLGHLAPGSYAKFAELTVIKEASENTKAADMIESLKQDHETLARRLREFFPRVEDANDQVSADLFTRRMEVHEKTAWMLRSLGE